MKLSHLRRETDRQRKWWSVTSKSEAQGGIIVREREREKERRLGCLGSSTNE